MWEFILAFERYDDAAVDATETSGFSVDAGNDSDHGRVIITQLCRRVPRSLDCECVP